MKVASIWRLVCFLAVPTIERCKLLSAPARLPKRWASRNVIVVDGDTDYIRLEADLQQQWLRCVSAVLRGEPSSSREGSIYCKSGERTDNVAPTMNGVSVRGAIASCSSPTIAI